MIMLNRLRLMLVIVTLVVGSSQQIMAMQQLSKECKLQIQDLADDVDQAKMSGKVYPNVLLYGSTEEILEIVQSLAISAEMDFVGVSGYDLADLNHIEAVHQVFDQAQESENGLIIFIDKAEQILAEKDTLNTTRVMIQNAFLSRTGTTSTKYMLVLATRDPEMLDLSVLRRIDRRIQIIQ